MMSTRTTARRARSLRSNGGSASVASAIRQIPRDKIIVTIGNYGYDWHDKGGDPDDVEEAWVDAGDSDAPPVFDRVSGNSTFAYQDENGHDHTVWLLDAASAFNELTLLDRAGIHDVALWKLGSEDPGLWSIFGRNTVMPRNTFGPDASRPGHECRHRRARRDPSDHRASDTGRTAADARSQWPDLQCRLHPRAAAVDDYA